MFKKTTNKPGEQGLIQHLVELRSRLIRCVVAVVLVFAALYPFANELYTLLAEPLMAQLPEQSSMIATGVAAPFLAPFKLCLFLSVVISLPVLFYQLWAFVAPGLYRHERILVVPLVFSSVLLFYLGIAFAYYVVFPLVFAFFTSVAPEGITVMTDISSYLDFVLKLFFAFGLVFEVPIATLLLVYTGISTTESLAQKRPYVIVSAFVIGMLLTPPDIFSQTLLAIPMWVLFELGLLASRFVMKKTAADDIEENDTVETEDAASKE
jgi:sec-independent protein translocase protein TatC